MTRPWIYALACVLVPLLWGVGVARVFDWLEARARRAKERPRKPRPHRPEIDYYI